MAFPTIAATATSAKTSGISSTVTVALPTGIVAGNLLIAAVVNGGGASLSWPAGWTELFDQNGGTAGQSAAYRFADGSEGASINCTLSGASAIAAMAAWRITGHHASTPPEVGTPPAVSSTSTPNPPSLTASWGAESNLWIAFTGIEGLRTVSAYPSNYGLSQIEQQSDGTATVDMTIGAAARQIAAATENPGTFTWDGTDNAVAQTIVVRPLPSSLLFNPAPFQPFLVR